MLGEIPNESIPRGRPGRQAYEKGRESCDGGTCTGADTRGADSEHLDTEVGVGSFLCATTDSPFHLINDGL